MRAAILEALRAGDERAGVPAIQLVVGRHVTDANVSALAAQFLRAADGRLRAMLLDDLDPNKYSQRVTAANSYGGGGLKLPADNNLFSSPQVVEFVSESLDSPSMAVREAARDLVAEHQDLAAMVGRQVTTPRPRPDYEFLRHVPCVARDFQA